MFNDGLYNLSASVMPSLTGALYHSLQPVSGNINIRRYPERIRYRDILVGSGTDTNSISVKNVIFHATASVPSWTQWYAGKKHAFVIPALSSSTHAASALNAYSSGTFPLETTAVPASATVYFEKQTRFVTKIYKLSASAMLPVVPTPDRNPSTVEYGSSPRTGMDTASFFHPASGSYRNSSYFNPSVFSINVPDYGRLRNARVWVELIHDVRGGPGTRATGYGDLSGTGDTNKNLKQGLQGLQIALRSPNVSFQSAHPLWNNAIAKTYQKRPDPALPSKYQGIPELLKSSYILWAGHQVEQDLGISLGGLTSSAPDNCDNPITVDSSQSGTLGLNQVGLTLDVNNQMNIVYADNDANGGSALGVIWVKTGSQGFSKRTLDGFGSIFDYASIDTNKQNGNLYVAYQNITNGTVNCIKSSSAGWSTPNVLTSDSGKYVSVAADTSDLAHVVYSVSNFIMYARSSSAAVTAVDKVDPFQGRYCDIAVDPSNQPHVSFIGQLGNSLVHGVSGSTTGWVLQVVDPTLSGYGNNEKTGIAVDSSGTVHISYVNSIGGQPYLMYARSSSFTGGWLTQSVTPITLPSNVAGVSTAISLDSVGRPQIVYDSRDTLTGDTINYIRSGTFGWSGFKIAQGIDQDPDQTGRAKIRVDSKNHYYIAYPFINNFHYTSNIFGVVNQAAVSSSAYAEFDTDIDMRTVFDDASPNVNPRDLSRLYFAATDTAPGNSLFRSISVLNHGGYASPLSGALMLTPISGVDGLSNLREGNGGLVRDQYHFLTGANVPWMLDLTTIPGTFRYHVTAFGLASQRLYTPAGGVPPGWLTNNGVAAANEWPTTGSQLGPETIQAVYPMMDDIFVQKIYDNPPVVSGVPGLPSPRSSKIIGFRPGLRGTEINGTWQLLIGNNADFDGSVGMSGSARDGYWFRQFRLELTFDQHRPLTYPFPSKGRRFDRLSNVPKNNKRRRIEILSGSSEWDIGINYVFTSQPDEYGRSVGITDQTGSSVDSFAVFSRITGSFADTLSGSRAGVFYTFLHNEFGTPFIPLSSGSGIAPSFDPFTVDEIAINRFIAGQVASTTNAVGSSNVLRSTLNRLNYFQTRRDTLLKNVQLGSTFGVSAFPINLSSSLFLKF